LALPLPGVLLLLRHGGPSFAAGYTDDPATQQIKTCHAPAIDRVVPRCIGRSPKLAERSRV